MRRIPYADMAMSERCARDILEVLEGGGKVPSNVVENLIVSTAVLIEHGIDLGDDADYLLGYLEAAYVRRELQLLPGFDEGAVFGATRLYEEIVQTGR